MRQQVIERTLVSRLKDGDTSVVSELERTYRSTIWFVAGMYAS